MRAIVIGAGSVGANIAYRVARAGHDVTVLDAGRPGEGTSGASISWLSSFPQVANASSEDLPLRLQTDRAYRTLHEEIGGDWLHWTGTLTWTTREDDRSRLHADREQAAHLGVEIRTLTGTQACRLDEALTIPDDVDVFYEEGGGWVDAPAMVRALLDAATSRGARLLTETVATGIGQQDGHVAAVRTGSGESLDADVIVDAGGSHAAHVAHLAGCALPLDIRPGLVVYATPGAGCGPQHVLDTPMMNIRPNPGGSVAIHWRGESLYGHHAFNAVDPQAVVDAAARWLPGLDGVAPSSRRIGLRPVPPGGPIIGPHPGLSGFYVAVSHGGIGWGPTWGRLVAQELEGRPASELSHLRPDRFFRDPRSRVEG